MYLYLKNNFLSVLLLGICFFYFSCESEPFVGLNNLTDNELKQKSFLVDQVLSKTIQSQENQQLNSPRLYAGILDDGNLAETFINIKVDILSSHDFCNSQTVEKFKLAIKTITDLIIDDASEYAIEKESLEITLLKGIELSYDEMDQQLEDLDNSSVIILDEFLELSKNEIEIDLFNHNPDLMEEICLDENIGIRISYSPIELDVEQFIEFRSSDVGNTSLKPSLKMKYIMNENDTSYVNAFSIMDVNWLSSPNFSIDNLEDPYVINDIEESQWGMIYAFDFKNSDQINSPIVYEDLEINSNIITDEINIQLDFLKIDLKIDETLDLDSIQFYLSNAVGFITDEDPMGDNWSMNDTTGTEKNARLDWIDGNYNGKWDNGEGERWFDYGLDNCPDSLETGINSDCGLSVTIYNSAGSEGNGQLDWDDDGDGIWEEGEGEKWEDVGKDGCVDEFEDGEGGCLSELNLDYIVGNDPNEDNYLFDPNEDDWNENDSQLTEGNGVYDPGEPFFDWGSDGLPSSLTNFEDDDDTENSGEWDPGEPFKDTGTDGLFNNDEPGYNEYGTENNNKFDGDGEFSDCGLDNDCQDMDSSDDYIIDPNGDNWDSETSIGTEGDNKHIWNDDGDGIWEEGEGEMFYDWGLDGIPDSLEAFYVANTVYPELGENIYEYEMQNQPVSFTNQFDNDISLWITEIIKSGDVLSVKFGIQTNIALKGLQFKLNHIPFEKISSLKEYDYSISYYGDDNLFEDLTLSNYEIHNENGLEINFSNDLSIDLYFNDEDGNSLGLFLENQERNLSHDFSHLVLHIDKNSSMIHDDGMILHLGYNDSSEEFISLNSYYVTSSIDSMIFPIGNILRGFQNKNYGDFNNFTIKTDGELYNYSKMIIYNDLGNNDHSKNPKIRLMYWE